jgi:CBS domain-containing protein
MMTRLRWCTPESTAAECAQIMRDAELGFVPVVDATGALLGVVTDRDLAQAETSAMRTGQLLRAVTARESTPAARR